MFKTTDNVKHIYAKDFYFDQSIPLDHVIDIREPLELQAMSLDGTLHIPMHTLLRHPDKYLNKHTRYYLLCRSGRRSHDVADILTRQGYDLVNIAGGILVIDELQARQS